MLNIYLCQFLPVFQVIKRRGRLGHLKISSSFDFSLDASVDESSVHLQCVFCVHSNS